MPYVAVSDLDQNSNSPSEKLNSATFSEAATEFSEVATFSEAATFSDATAVGEITTGEVPQGMQEPYFAVQPGLCEAGVQGFFPPFAAQAFPQGGFAPPLYFPAQQFPVQSGQFPVQSGQFSVQPSAQFPGQVDPRLFSPRYVNISEGEQRGRSQYRSPAARNRSKERMKIYQQQQKRSRSAPPKVNRGSCQRRPACQDAQNSRPSMQFREARVEDVLGGVWRNKTAGAKARENAAARAEGPQPFNRNPGTQPRPSPVQPPKPPANPRYSSPEEIEEARYQQLKRDKEQCELNLAAFRYKREQAKKKAEAAAIPKQKPYVPRAARPTQQVMSKAVGPGTNVPPPGSATTLAIPIDDVAEAGSEEQDPLEEVPLAERQAKRRAEEKTAAATTAKKQQRARDSRKHRITVKSMHGRVEQLEGIVLGLAGQLNKTPLQTETSHFQVCSPLPQGSSPEVSNVEPSVFRRATLTRRQSKRLPPLPHLKAMTKASPKSSSLDPCLTARKMASPLAQRALATKRARKTRKVRKSLIPSAPAAREKNECCASEFDHWSTLVDSGASIAADLKRHEYRAVESGHRSVLVNSGTDSYILTPIRVARARALASMTKGDAEAWGRDEPTGGGYNGADRDASRKAACPETHPSISPGKVGNPNDSLGDATLKYVLWLGQSTTPPVVWFTATKLLNKLAHAINGNMFIMCKCTNTHYDGRRCFHIIEDQDPTHLCVECDEEESSCHVPKKDWVRCQCDQRVCQPQCKYLVPPPPPFTTFNDYKSLCAECRAHEDMGDLCSCDCRSAQPQLGDNPEFDRVNKRNPESPPDSPVVLAWATVMSLVYSTVWAITRKARNKLIHALNGNMPSSIVRKVHLDGAPILVGEHIDLETFLLWTIDLKAYCEMSGLTKYIIGPEPAAPSDPDKLEAHNENLAEGLRYLCGMCEDRNLKATIALNASSKGTEGYKYLVKEFLQGQPVQSRYLAMLQGMSLKRTDSVVLFRNKWQKVVTQLNPKPDDAILCEMFAHAVTIGTGSFYDTCLDQDITRTNYNDYTQTLTQLCQKRKDRLDKRSKDDGEGIAGGNSAQAMKAAIQREVRKAVGKAPTNRRAARETKHEPSPKANKTFKPGRQSGNDKREECLRCGKMHAGGRKACKEPVKKCTFRFPDGEICGGDHAEQFCWGRHPELCKIPRVQKAILRRLGKSANQTSVEEDSDDDESGTWGDRCSHSVEIIYPEGEKVLAHDCKVHVEYPKLTDATEGIVDITCLLSDSKNEMFVDTGANDHIMVDSRCVVQPELHKPSGIRIKTGNSVSRITSIGPVSYNVKTSTGDMYTITRRALYANEAETGFSVNLWSVPLDYDVHGSVATFDPTNTIILSDKTVIPFERDGQRRYVIKYYPIRVSDTSSRAKAHTDRDGTKITTTALQNVPESPPANPMLHLWHRRLGHCSLKVIMQIPKHVVGIPTNAWTETEVLKYLSNCEICPKARLKAAAHPNNRVITVEKPIKMELDKMCTVFGERVMMDLAGPLTPSLGNGYRYVSLFVDDGTDAEFVYFAVSKSDQKNLHQRFRADTTRYGKVLEYHSDNGGEYKDKEYLIDILNEGAARTFSVAYKPNTNNKAEHAFWSIFCVARALLFESGLPPIHWPYAVQHAVYLRNRAPVRRTIAGEKVWRTPYLALHKRFPSSRHMKVWGSRCSVETLKVDRQKSESPKLAPRAETGYYMGRSVTRKAYIIFLPEEGCETLNKGKYVERCTIIFHEDKTPRAIREMGMETVAPPQKVITGSPGSDDSEDEQPATPKQRRDPCGRPGCTFENFHDGACSFERVPISSGRPSANLRRRAPIGGVAADNHTPSRIPRPHGLATGVTTEKENPTGVNTAEFKLGSGARLVWANNASRFKLDDALYATNILDNEDIAEALKTENGELLQALVAKQKMFRNEGDGTFQTMSVPKTLRDILKLPENEQQKWIESMWDELKSHLGNGTWILIPASKIPGKRRMVGSTWAFDIKRDAKGIICRWKSRLCAQGFTQEEGVDYFETYSNTIRYETLRLILALAALYNLQLSSIDIKTAYLNGSIEEGVDIYMTLPRGFTFFMDKDCPAGKAEFNDTNEPDRNYAGLLKRSIYGLKQSGRRWEIRFWEFLRTLNAVQCEIDPCLWKIKEKGDTLLIAIYVDDVVFATNSPQFRDHIVGKLKAAFQVVDQGPLTWIFGTAIHQDLSKGTVQINQRLYIEDLVQKYSPRKLKGRAVPCTPDILHEEDTVKDGEVMIHPQYRTIIGQLLWLTVISRPDIAYATTYLARFTARGTQERFEDAVRVVAYLEVTANQCITYSRERIGHMREHILAHSCLKEYPFSKNTILTYTDSSHGGERPMAGYVGFLADGPITWSAFRLTVTPLSSCQGEYHAATKAAVMSKAYADILRFTGYPAVGAAPIFCDNRAAVLLSESDISSKKLRHVATHIAFLRELANSEDIALIHISTAGQIADIFTKPLAPAIFHELRAYLTAPHAV